MERQRQDNSYCYIELMGPLRVTLGDQTLTQFATQKTSALLVWLALHPGPQPRERVIDLFWQEMEISAGRNNLSTTLVSIRRHLEPPGVRRGSVLIATHADVGLNPDAISTDAASFENLLKQAGRGETPEKRIALLQRAVELYRGEILPGSYHDWAVRATERLQARLEEALTWLARDMEAIRDFAGALEAVQRHVALDPYSESLHCHLIRLYVETGHRSLAREAHERFERLYEQEFGATPSHTTQDTVASLLASTSRAVPPSAPYPLDSTRPGRVSSGADRPTSRASHVASILPASLSRFFGRDGELRELAKLLLPRKGIEDDLEEPEPPERLATLIGPGGIGKTRLAVEFARQVAARSTSWCGFVSLAEIAEPGHAAQQIAEALRLSTEGGADSLDRVVAFLQERDHPGAPPLLILDNLEHLLPGEEADPSGDKEPVTSLVQTLMERVPGLTLLCTSRRRLGLRGERLVPVTPLPVPANPDLDGIDPAVIDDTLAALYRIPSIRLYVDRAQSVRPDFSLTASNAPVIAALCRQLEGSPLGIELAAAWVRILPPRKMWERLTQGLDIPAGSYTDLPPRHRTLSAALDWSFRLLTPAQQQLFARLSVFRGGWTQEAAEAVCDEPEAMQLLAGLQDASLVTAAEEAEGAVRYSFLETIRVFSAHQLEDRGETEMLQHRHASYYLAFAETAVSHQRGAQQGVWLTRTEAEHDNLRAVIARLRSESHLPVEADFGLRLAAALHRFWLVRGYWHEGLDFVNFVLDRAVRAEPSLTLARVLSSAAGLYSHVGEFARAQAFHEEALAQRRALNDRRGEGDILHNLGLLALTQGDLDRAQILYTASLDIQRELNDNLGIADELHHLGMVAHERGDLGTAQALYEESLALRKPYGDLRGIAFSLQNLANVAAVQGDHEKARQICVENLAIRRELGDRRGIADAYHNLASYAQQMGDREAARSLYRRSLAMRKALNDWHGIIASLESVASFCCDEARLVQAARLYAAAAALRVRLGAVRTPLDEQIHAPRQAMLQEQFSAEQQAALSNSSSVSWEQDAADLLGPLRVEEE